MKTPQNTFKQALARNEAQIGLWVGLGDPYAAELCATAGFDWLLVDGEHGPNDLKSTLGALQAVSAYKTHPVVRLPQGDTALIKQVLEIGATTLLIPMVESAVQAAELVRAVRYPPAGIRGVGSGLARSSRWGLYPNYPQEANDEICLLVQAETLSALDAIDEIASVDGVDGVFIGPADLSASMGFLGQPTHPEVKARIEKAFGQIQAQGKALGIFCTDETLARHYLSLGASFVAVGVDATLLAQAARSLSARFKSDASALHSRPTTGSY